MTDLDALRAEAFAELEVEKPVEEIKGQIIDNTETIKKIEESRVFVSAEKQESKTNNWFKPNPSSSQSSSPSSSQTKVVQPTYQNSYNYPYQNPYAQKVETLDQKAHDVTSKLFKDFDERAKQRILKGKKKNISNWTMLQSADSKELSKREGKKATKVITKKQAKRRILFCQMGLAVIKATMESIYVLMKERK